MASGIRCISTHVLDTVLGKPARNVAVRLEKQEVSGWRLIASGRTEQDGRCNQLLPEEDTLAPGTYRLVFDTAIYFASLMVDALYPVVEITFSVKAGESRFHIPLLLSPNGYTTYRGS
ncbi:MAG: hydroxyisourate hydrolase [Candidatus Sulfotelmatobacter sp.]